MSADAMTTPPELAEEHKLKTLSNNDLQITQAPALDGNRAARPTAKRDVRFWMCFLAIMISTLLIAMDIGGVPVALPIIVRDLHGIEFEWVGSAYSLSSTAFIPLSGGLAQVFGRRATMLQQILFFAVGSAMCGAAPSMAVLIAGRTIQGVGAGGIVSLTQIVIADLVPLHERGAYNGLIAIAYVLGSAGSPVIAGALAQNGQWRWYFYLNLPVCGVAAFIVAYYLKLKTPSGTFKEKLSKLDWIGNFIVVASTTAVVIGLTWGGIVAPWSSARVLVPLVLGMVGLAVFITYESLQSRHPLVPLGVLSNWTSISGYVQSACTSYCMLALIYYLVTFYEACEEASPVRAGVNTFGTSCVLMPFGIIVGISITKSGKYKPQLCVAWIFIIVASALLCTIDVNTSRSAVLGYQALFSAGLGPLVTSLIFPILAPLPVLLNANALAFMAFVRFFAQIFGVTVGGTILQNELTKKLPASFTSQFPSGTSIAYSIIPLIQQLEEPLRSEVRTAFAQSLRFVWVATACVAGLGFLCSLTMRSLPLTSTLDEQWGLEEEQMVGERVAP